jgi:hypothetical protein
MKKSLSAQPRIIRIALLAVVIAVAFQTSSSANHSWNGYHWARTSNPFTIALGDNVSAGWDDYLTLASGNASSGWTKSTVLDTSIVLGGTTKPRTCKPTSGRVEVCNAAYGFNGWLGVAQIWVSGSHITQGTVKMNDSYFNTATYNSPAWRQMVMCQEVGHTFGLDHQDENFNNTNLGTCMDYTDDPARNDGNGNNLYPNQHDYDELVTIYSHLDSSTTVGATTPSAAPAVLENPSEWGQLMKVSHGGKTQVFEREFGNGQKVVTFVIWA